jgi:hypothetical protein
MSWGNASSICMHKPARCMHWPVMSQANACTYCMGSKVSSLSRINLCSNYFAIWKGHHHRYQKSLNRLLKVCYVPATNAVLIAFFFAAAIKSINEANKAAGTCHQVGNGDIRTLDTNRCSSIRYNSNLK